MSVRAIRQLKGDDPVRSTPSDATLTAHRPARPAGPARAGEPRGRTPPATRPSTSPGTRSRRPPRYRVQLGSDDSFRNPRVLTTDSRTATFKGLDAATPFVVRVRALGEQGSKSAWTETIKTATIKPDDPQPLAVGTYNIRCHKLRRSAMGQPARRDRLARSRPTASTSSACRRPSSRLREAWAPASSPTSCGSSARSGRVAGRSPTSGSAALSASASSTTPGPCAW